MMSILSERDDLTYAILDAKDLAEVADITARGFTDGSEPIARAFGITPERFTQFLEALLPKFLREGLSIVARDAQTGEIAGAQLNEELGTDLPVDPSQFEWAAPVLALASHLYQEYFQGPHSAAGEVVHCFIIGVSKSYRGRAIAQQLLNLSLELARERGYSGAVVEATGIVSQHVFAKAGFVPRVEVPYATFEYEGNLPFKTTGEHPGIMLMDRDL